MTSDSAWDILFSNFRVRSSVSRNRASDLVENESKFLIVFSWATWPPRLGFLMVFRLFFAEKSIPRPPPVDGSLSQAYNGVSRIQSFSKHSTVVFSSDSHPNWLITSILMDSGMIVQSWVDSSSSLGIQNLRLGGTLSYNCSQWVSTGNNVQRIIAWACHQENNSMNHFLGKIPWKIDCCFLFWRLNLSGSLLSPV